ncbi:DUF2855 family protein [Piscinibacter sp. XHJ-5]|uniref:DUF2855 family protein n=1 Tax=Piscinibacter sp. XHJ-5 TaxID=3037797 RepID=UPI0024531B6F|nr:DUF2855 family protein [Piscinibacter sp. XHJ-5]
MTASSFIVKRDDLRQTRSVDDAAATSPLPAGAVRARIDLFALTSNNVTYGAFGDTMHYWDFFPCEVAGFGHVPVWGFADIVESQAEGVVVGDRCYGYYPMSSHVILEPVQAGRTGFVDAAAHRQALHALYNKYLCTTGDPLYRREHEAEIALLRPLFTTSFLIDDFLADQGFFGARSVVLASASSKTAYGTAFCLSQRRGTPGAPRIVGLTSPANVAFTRGLGCYDDVVAYDEFERLPADEPCVYVDMSGSAPLRERVHAHWNDRLMHSCAVGGTHWSELGGGQGLAGPRPVLFFAPAQAQKRIAEWGGAGLAQRIAAAWTAFMKPVTDPASPWLTVVRGHGAREVEAAWRGLIEGGADPRRGQVLRL